VTYVSQLNHQEKDPPISFLMQVGGDFLLRLLILLIFL